MLGKSGAGPDLTRAASARPTDWLLQHFKQPAPNVTTQLKNPELRGLVSASTRSNDSEDLPAPDFPSKVENQPDSICAREQLRGGFCCK